MTGQQTMKHPFEDATLHLFGINDFQLYQDKKNKTCFTYPSFDKEKKCFKYEKLEINRGHFGIKKSETVYVYSGEEKTDYQFTLLFCEQFGYPKEGIEKLLSVYTNTTQTKERRATI